jgi:hypothetical protein
MSCAPSAAAQVPVLRSIGKGQILEDERLGKRDDLAEAGPLEKGTSWRPIQPEE